MSSDWWKKVEDAYHAARELSGEERSRLLDAACSSDAAMRRQVDMLLQQDENPDSFLNTRSVRSATPLAAGIQLGSYCIEAPVGEGGMGVVYRARDA